MRLLRSGSPSVPVTLSAIRVDDASGLPAAVVVHVQDIRVQYVARETLLDEVDPLAADAGVPTVADLLQPAELLMPGSQAFVVIGARCALSALARVATTSPEPVTVVPDASRDPRTRFDLQVSGGVRFFAGAPMVTPGGMVIGALCLVAPVPGALGAEARTRLATLARAATERAMRMAMNQPVEAV